MIKFFTLVFFISLSILGRTKKDTYDEDIKEIISEYSSEDYIETANLAYKLSKTKETGEVYYYLAKSLFHLGLSHASAEFLYNAALNGGNVLDDVIQAIRYLMKNRPFDHDLLISDLIGDHIFGVMNDDNSDFIHYYKGYLAHRDNVIKWMRYNFDKIRPFSNYHYRAQLVDIVDNVKGWRITKGLSLAEKLARADITDPIFKNEVLQTYARLLFQKKQYYKAYDVYRIISYPPTQSESIYLEKAWTLFYLQDYQGALGNLLSLDAKIFEGYNRPERFVLQGLIFQKLCNYDLALSTINAFRKTYEKILIGIKERKKIDDDPYLKEAFKRHKLVKKLYDFYEMILWEKNELKEYDVNLNDEGLYHLLRKMYFLKEREIKEQIENLKNDVYPLLAETLLEAEEQINYLEYEIKMDKLKRSKIFLSEEEKELVKARIGEEEIKAENAYKWPFEGEFWTDELGTFRVLVSDSCSIGSGF